MGYSKNKTLFSLKKICKKSSILYKKKLLVSSNKSVEKFYSKFYIKVIISDFLLFFH